jgi:hypothetical protein
MLSCHWSCYLQTWFCKLGPSLCCGINQCIQQCVCHTTVFMQSTVLDQPKVLTVHAWDNTKVTLCCRAKVKLHPWWYQVKIQELLWRVGFLFLALIPNLVSKVRNCLTETNFLINKVRNRGNFLFTSCLPSTNMGISLPKSCCRRPLHKSENVFPWNS